MHVTTEFESFAPVARADARVLVLGSMPSVRSVADSQYYAHPQNQFWPFMDELLGAGRDLAYPERLSVLQERGVALWDVAHRCRRDGSADATMTDIEANDIPRLLERLPRIRAIFCNGRKAEQMFRKLVEPGLGKHRSAGLHIAYLPSTSPANASVRREEKLSAWRAVLDWLPA